MILYVICYFPFPYHNNYLTDDDAVENVVEYDGQKNNKKTKKSVKLFLSLFQFFNFLIKKKESNFVLFVSDYFFLYF